MESTPKINANEVKRQQAASTTPEELFLNDVKPTPPSKWQPDSYRLYVTDTGRLPLVFPNATGNYSDLEGQILTFKGFRPMQGLVNPEVEAVFESTSGAIYPYPTHLQQAQLDTATVLSVPFTIPMDIVEEVNRRIAGKEYFVRTPHWYTAGSRQGPPRRASC